MFQVMKSKWFKNDAFVILEKNKRDAEQWFEVRLRAPSGTLHDKIRCDDYRMALDYWKAFNAIAKNM